MTRSPLDRPNRYNGHILNARNNGIGFVSQIIDVLDDQGDPTGYFRTIVTAQDAEIMSLEMQGNYDVKSFMSFDGMFRPVSMDGDGNLPQYCQGTDRTCSGCSVLTPDTFVLTIAGTTADPGEPDINGTFSLSYTGSCSWTFSGIPSATLLFGANWILTIQGSPSNAVAGPINCTAPNAYTFAAISGQDIVGATFTVTGVKPVRLDDLNPWTNPQGMSRDKVADLRSDTPTIGHDLDLVARIGTDFLNTPDGGLGMTEAGYKQGDVGVEAFDYTDDYRFVAIKLPLIGTGWGYDCDGFPVPNKNDVEADAEQGIFIKAGRDPEKFLDGHLRKPKTWPTMPIEFRADLDRCLWVTSGCGDTAVSSSSADIDCDTLKPIFSYSPGAHGTGTYLLSFVNGVCSLVEDIDIPVDCDDIKTIFGYSPGTHGTGTYGLAFVDGACEIACVGVTLTSSSNQVDCGTAINPTGQNFCNIDFGCGFCVTESTPNTAEISISIDSTDSDLCVNTPTNVGDFCSVEWGKGLSTEITSGNALVSLYLDINQEAGCVREEESTDTEGQVSHLLYGTGICVDIQTTGTGGEECKLAKIGVGIPTTATNDCIPEDLLLDDKFCEVVLGGNLQGRIDTNTGILEVGSGITIIDRGNGDAETFIHKLSVDDVTFSVDGDCSIAELATGAVDCDTLADEFGLVTPPAAAGNYVLMITSDGANNFTCTAVPVVACDGT